MLLQYYDSSKYETALKFKLLTDIFFVSSVGFKQSPKSLFYLSIILHTVKLSLFGLVFSIYFKLICTSSIKLFIDCII